jgi:hypothetical protein
MTFSFSSKHTLKALVVLLASAVISACSSTSSNEPTIRISNTTTQDDYYQRIDTACEQQAIEMDSFAQQSGQNAQYLASAKAMLRCVDGIQFAKGHPNADQALRLMAMSVMNFVKGGDINAAQKALKVTRIKFPNQDLFFADYSSFFDTATALIEQQKLSRQQLAALNISAPLRAEIERQQYWLSH